jgi:hypothetical protein
MKDVQKFVIFFNTEDYLENMEHFQKFRSPNTFSTKRLKSRAPETPIYSKSMYLLMSKTKKKNRILNF